MSLIGGEGSSAGGLGMGMGVGNYKGVMLCNRPFGNSAVATMKSSQGEKSSFICGVVPEPSGTNVPIGTKEKLLKRPKKDSVLCKHKKWLADLQKTKERLEMQYLEEIQSKEEAQAKFQEHEKTMREKQLTIIHSTGQLSGGAESKGTIADGAVAASEFKSQFKSFPAESKKSSRPVWALTEKDADMAADRKEQQEEEELLKFAEGLDFDKYVNEVEVQTTMDRLHRRIAELEREVAAEEHKEADNEARQAKKELLSLLAKTESSIATAGSSAGSGELTEEERRALAAARQLLQDDDDMQAVHSAKSVSALLKTAKEKIQAVNNSVRPPASPAGPSVSNEVCFCA